MSDPADITQLEEVRKDLLQDEDEFFTVVLLDGETIKSSWEVPAKITNPFDTDVNRFLTTEKPMDLERFFAIASELINNAQLDKAEEQKFRLVEEYPPEEMQEYGTEVITFRVLYRRPARMNAKGTGRPQRRSTFHHYEKDCHLPNKVIEIESRPLDHLIEFSAWSTTNKDANKVALWLERLLVAHSWAFLSQGCERFYFNERRADVYTTSQGQRLFQRPLVFDVRFREYNVRAHPEIKSFVLEGKPIASEFPLVAYTPGDTE